MKKCLICNGECEKDVIHGAFIYWKCVDCFTSQVFPQPTQLELKKYYDNYHLKDVDGGVYDEVEDRMKADFPQKVRLVSKYKLVNNPRLLDVGCGKGFFVKAATENGINAEGIDFSQSGVDYAINILGVRAVSGLIEDQARADWKNAFDVVTFWATIEHLTDPLAVLQSIYDALKPGGILICDTGLGHAQFENLLTGHSQWYDAPQHMFVFSEKGLIAILVKAGFKIINIDTNFERSSVRRWVRLIRHSVICILTGLLIGPLLGRRSSVKAKLEAKWPIGRLMSVVVQKI